jgi:hypothetical protein
VSLPLNATAPVGSSGIAAAFVGGAHARRAGPMLMLGTRRIGGERLVGQTTASRGDAAVAYE